MSKMLRGKHGVYSKDTRIPLEGDLSARTMRQLAFERGFALPLPQGPDSLPAPTEIPKALQKRIEKMCAQQLADEAEGTAED